MNTKLHFSPAQLAPAWMVARAAVLEALAAPCLQNHVFSWSLFHLQAHTERAIMSPTEKKPDICAEVPSPAKAGHDVNQSNLPATQTHLAWMRTRMSLESVLAAWVRTATSLIGFGFAIVQFFEHFNETRGLSGQHLARYVGLVLIGTGSLATAVALWEYHKALRYLESDAFRGVAGVPGIRRVYPAVFVAVLLCFIGLLAFFTILVGGKLPWPGNS